MATATEHQWVRFGDRRHAMAQEVDAIILERVQKGLDLLREEHGEDWVDHINVDRLDLCNSEMCVLGQLYDGHYSDGVEALGLDSGSDIACDVWLLNDYDKVRYEQLDEVWKEVIAAFQQEQ